MKPVFQLAKTCLLLPAHLPPQPGDATNPFQTIERKDVGINLTVTPQINEGNSVVLDIEQEVSSLTGATGDLILLLMSVKYLLRLLLQMVKLLYLAA